MIYLRATSQASGAGCANEASDRPRRDSCRLHAASLAGKIRTDQRVEVFETDLQERLLPPNWAIIEARSPGGRVGRCKRLPLTLVSLQKSS